MLRSFARVSLAATRRLPCAGLGRSFSTASAESAGVEEWISWAARNKGQAILLYAGLFTAIVMPVQGRAEGKVRTSGLGYSKNFALLEERHRVGGCCLHGRTCEQCHKHPEPVPHVAKH